MKRHNEYLVCAHPGGWREQRGRGAWDVGHGAWSVVGCGDGSVLEISRSKWHLTGSQALAR